MWCLKGREDFCVYILPNQRKSFGKSLSDIKLVGDVTISRLHAVVSVEQTEESETQYKCIVNDVSKYGTFVIRDKKKEKLFANVKFVLKAGDIVQFGLKESIFVVFCYSFIIARSSLDEEDIKKLKDIVFHLKAELSETWENFCTHLTVAKNTLFTTKLAYALASAKPIVTTAYWEAVDVAVKESKELPEVKDFLPKLKEEWLKVCSRLFLPNEKRRTLFKDISFVHFCVKQYFTYAPLITVAGGKSCVYPTKRPLTPRDLAAKNAVVVQQPTNDSSQLTQVITADYPIIYHQLQVVKRRIISDTEILLAILYCTTEKYCNPKYNFAIFLKLETPTFFSSDMIIENTQDIINTNTKKIKRKIIPETCESQNNDIVLKKILCLDENKKKYISDINKSNIVMKQNTDNEKFKRKITSETFDFRINKKISKNLFYENEQKYIFDTNESYILMKNMQDAVNEEMKHKMIGKTYDSHNNSENISKEIYFFNESEQEYVSDISRSNIPVNIQDRNIKNINFSNESELNNISEYNSNNVNIILPNNIYINKQFQIIPDSCYSLEKNTNNISFDKNNEPVQIFETCNFNETLVNNFATKKEQNIKLQKNEIFKENNMTFIKIHQKINTLQENGLQQQENMIINKKPIFEQNNLNGEENMIVGKDNLSNNNNKFIARWETSKNIKISQIVSIKEINDSEIYIKGKKNDLFGKDSNFELQSSMKEQKLGLNCNSEKKRENKKVKEDKIQTKNNKKEFRETGENWHENQYLNQEFTNEILRKGVPCGKNFIKMFVMKPKKILRADDFIL